MRLARRPLAVSFMAEHQIQVDKTLDIFIRESIAREKRSDERVEKLVSAIGALIGKIPPQHSSTVILRQQ